MTILATNSIFLKHLLTNLTDGIYQISLPIKVKEDG